MVKYEPLSQDEDSCPLDSRIQGVGRRNVRLERFNFVLGVVAGIIASLGVFLVFYSFASYQAKQWPLEENVIVSESWDIKLSAPDSLQERSESSVDEILPLREKGQGPYFSRFWPKWPETIFEKKNAVDNVYRTSVSFKKSQSAVGASCTANESDRFDCWPEFQGATEQGCQARGCCWNPKPSVYGVPYCFFPDGYVSYSVSQVSRLDTSAGMTATLQRQTASPFPDDVVQLQLEVVYETDNRLRFKIYDPKNQRYEVPINLTKTNDRADNPDYNVTLQSSPFGILVQRKSNGAILFDSRNMAPLVFADQFLQIGTRLSSSNIYGLGEHRHALKLDSKWQRLVLWTRDMPPGGGGNLYGSHPFYLNLEADGQAHGVFLLNSNGMELVLQPYGGGQGALTYHAMGGVLDFYVFTGPSPQAVVEQYVSLIGLPNMPPFWSLGFHLCKYGYWNSTELRKVIQRNRALGIPYDVQWNDIDYMNKNLDWTYNGDQRYKGLREIVDDLHKNDQRYVMIIDPGISSSQAPGTYAPFDQGKEMDIFIKNATGQILVGKVWPGETAFPDFFHPKADEYWFNQMQSYHTKIPFDGIWIDMNEPSNFVDGSVNGCTSNSLDNPPFSPPTVNGGRLMSRTVCPSAQQAISSHYNLHNMYGWSETRATSNGLKKLLGKRSFVLSRSSFPSSGYYGNHWLGDNASRWPDLYTSIPGILNFNMFGVPMVGADICGFGGNTNQELCIRWMQLGAFYPFMRNHDSLLSQPQDPAMFNSTAVSYMKAALEIRYSLLPYMYTRFFFAHTSGTPVIKPLFFSFKNTEAIDKQFMWGDELLVSPALDEGATTVSAYFPEGRWYDLYNRSALTVKTGGYIELQAPLSTINLHFRGGSILPILSPAVTTNALRKKPFSILACPDENGNAVGKLYWDDGESLDSIENKKYLFLEFNMAGGSLKSSVTVGNFPAILGAVQVLDVAPGPSKISLNGQPVTNFKYLADSKVLTVGDGELNVDLQKPFTLTWS